MCPEIISVEQVIHAEYIVFVKHEGVKMQVVQTRLGFNVMVRMTTPNIQSLCLKLRLVSLE